MTEKDELIKNEIENDLLENKEIENEETVMKFKDEDGNVIELEVVAKIYLEEKEYLILSQEDNEEDEFVFRVDEDEEGNIEYNAIESDEEFLKVKKEYSKLLYDEK